MGIEFVNALVLCMLSTMQVPHYAKTQLGTVDLRGNVTVIEIYIIHESIIRIYSIAVLKVRMTYSLPCVLLLFLKERVTTTTSLT